MSVTKDVDPNMTYIVMEDKVTKKKHYYSAYNVDEEDNNIGVERLLFDLVKSLTEISNIQSMIAKFLKSRDSQADVAMWKMLAQIHKKVMGPSVLSRLGGWIVNVGRNAKSILRDKLQPGLGYLHSKFKLLVRKVRKQASRLRDLFRSHRDMQDDEPRLGPSW